MVKAIKIKIEQIRRRCLHNIVERRKCKPGIDSISSESANNRFHKGLKLPQTLETRLYFTLKLTQLLRLTSNQRNM